MQVKEISWMTVLRIAGAIVSMVFLCTRLEAHTQEPVAGLMTDMVLPSLSEAEQGTSPFTHVFKLIAAALAGLAVTFVYGRQHRDRLPRRVPDQAPIVLCVAGALMTIVIGDSLARALGLAGGASIIRFRTPVKDPKNASILFALLGLGGACGLGAFAVAVTGTVFLCLLLAAFDFLGKPKPRIMLVELVSAAPEFPSTHVQNVFAQYGLAFEAREFLQSPEAVVKYNVTLDPRTSLNDVSAHLLNGAAGIKSVAWQVPKKDGGAYGV